MRRPVEMDQPEREVVILAAQVIRRGGVVLSPTDTIYGLACDPFQTDAVERVLQLKGRPAEKGFLVLVRDLDAISRVAQRLPLDLPQMAAELWPGPFTLLLEARPDLPGALVGTSRKVGCRCPDSPFLLAWMGEFGGPILSTSANRAGEATPRDPEALDELFGSEVDLFLDGGISEKASPSTVVDLTTEPHRVVRKGAGFERLLEASRKLGLRLSQ